MLPPPKDFPKCGNYQPEVAKPPVHYEEKPHSISLANGSSNPHNPPYDVMTTNAPHKHSTKRPGKGKSSSSTLIPNLGVMALIYLIPLAMT